MSRSPAALRFPLLAALACLALHSTSLAQAPIQQGEVALEAIPIDLECNDAGSYAVVRGVRTATPWSVNDAIVIIDTQSGAISRHSGLTPGFYTGARPARAPGQSSDTVRIVGDTAVLIANTIDSNQTLIDVVDVRNLNCSANFMLPPTGEGQAEVAHDVEITPDGRFAVVSSSNWIFILKLSVSPIQVIQSVNTGNYHPSWAQNNFVFPTDAVDSVAVTNTRGIVLMQGRRQDTTQLVPIPYLIDFSQDSIAPPVTFIDMAQHLPGTAHFMIHDVGVSGLGDLAVCTYDGAVSLIDLSVMAHVGTAVDTNVDRLWGEPVDSVELAGDHAVVIGNHGTNTSIKVFSLRSGVPPVPLLTQKLDFESSNDGMKAHDLAVQPPFADPGETIAVVRAGVAGGSSTNGRVWIVRDVTGQPSVDTTNSPTSTGTPYPGGISPDKRTSDSIATLFARVGSATKRFAVAIGTQHPNNSTITQGSAVINWVGLEPGAASGERVVSGLPADPTVPFDLAVGPASGGVSRAFVRCWAPPDDAGTGGRDVLVFRFDTASPSLETTIGGSGVVADINMADLILMKGNRVVSIMRSPSSETGYVHTTTNP